MGGIRERIDTTDFPAKRYFQINSCGVKTAAIHNFTILRSKGRADFHILYIQSGCVTVEIDGNTQKVEAGQCLVYPPMSRQLYSFLVEDHPITYYVYFTGNNLHEIPELDSFRNVLICNIVDRVAFEGKMRQLVHIFSTGIPTHTTEENGILLQLIAMLSRNCNPSEKPARKDIIAAAAYMREHFQEQISRNDCAAMQHISASRFSHLFVEEIGMSPHKFLLSLRIDQAKEYLINTDISIIEVSENVGFSDVSYFGRLFRQRTGLSPKEYRQKHFLLAESEGKSEP